MYSRQAGGKSIDNWFSHNKKGTWDGLQAENFSASSDKPVNPLRYDKKGSQTNPLRYDEKYY